MNASQVALLTGASGGIGAAISSSLALDGWFVQTPPRRQLDLSSKDSVGLFLSSGSTPDGLVLCAGVNDPEAFDDISDESWNHTMMTNLESSFLLLRALVPSMAHRGFGRVVVISSLFSSRARSGRAAYSVSKSGLESLVRAVSVEFSRFGVLANAVSPGFVDTPLTRKNNSPADISKLLERVPVGRLANPSEIAEAVTFLLSPRNTYITGQVLCVDGGWSCT